MAQRRLSRSGSSGPPHSPPRPEGSAPADDEFIGGQWEEESLVSLDFDDAASSRSLHDSEPESAFDTFDRPEVSLDRSGQDAADLVDAISNEPFDDRDEEE